MFKTCGGYLRWFCYLFCSANGWFGVREKRKTIVQSSCLSRDIVFFAALRRMNHFLNHLVQSADSEMKNIVRSARTTQFKRTNLGGTAQSAEKGHTSQHHQTAQSILAPSNCKHSVYVLHESSRCASSSASQSLLPVQSCNCLLP